MTEKEKFIDIAVLLGTAFAILAALFANFAKECDALHDSTFRLHIIAASDSETDQKVKYALRDYLLSDLGGIFEGCGSAAEAKEAAMANSEYISRKAGEFLEARGCGYSATVAVCEDDFPTRVYGDFTLPSGRYSALKVVLGDGGGGNWWCVLYPSVCLGAAGTQKSALPQRALYERDKAANRMTADSLKAQRGEVEYRFALYDFIRGLFAYTGGLSDRPPDPLRYCSY